MIKGLILINGLLCLSLAMEAIHHGRGEYIFDRDFLIMLGVLFGIVLGVFLISIKLKNSIILGIIAAIFLHVSVWLLGGYSNTYSMIIIITLPLSIVYIILGMSLSIPGYLENQGFAYPKLYTLGIVIMPFILLYLYLLLKSI